ncbi:hypothetical protein GCM10023321_85580 [Pseudonocardia eucalypti]|uniref:TraG P-loop domain-containing protein n=1 Tax=Pseudonocardia eucalypti TaxID=648755 RepID=A0ABP9RFS3_9PSEU|nr:hypothetical protein [Pseudonocardia eucalypti]MBB6380766.1 hypothetical protein [Pseudonocardia eucalypti]
MIGTALLRRTFRVPLTGHESDTDAQADTRADAEHATAAPAGLGPTESTGAEGAAAGDESGGDPGPVGFGPEELHLGARVIATETGWVAVLAVTGYPAQVYPGWLEPLAGYPGRLDVSIHVEPVPAMAAADRLKKRQARLEAGRWHGAEHGKLADPLVVAAADDAAELAARIARGQARLYRVGLCLAVYAPDPHTLADEVAAVRAMAASLLLDARPASYRQLDGWTSCLPFGIDALDTRRVMDTDPLAAAFPFASNDLPAVDPARPDQVDGVLVGINLGSAGLVFHDEFTATNYNTVVLGQSGSGKSYFVKCRLLRSLYRGVHVFVVDPEDEYTRLVHAAGGTVVRLGAPGVHLNPLDLTTHPATHTGPAADVHPAGNGFGNRFTEHALFVHTFLALALGREPSPLQRAVLDEAITVTYRRAGIHPDRPGTWTRPAPLLADLAAALAAHPNPAGRELATELHPYAHGAYARLFAGHTTLPSPAGHPAGQSGPHLVSFSLRALPEELQPAATLLVLQHIWRHVSAPATRRPRLVVIDEAWRLMSQPSAARYVARLARTVRKCWAGLMFVSQDLADVLGTDLGNTVINNSATSVLFRQADQLIDEVADRFHLTAGEHAFLRRAAPGELLLSTGNQRVAAKALASDREDELATTDPRDTTPAPGPGWTGGQGGW